CQNLATPSQGFPAIPVGRGFPGRIAALANLKRARHSLRSPPCPTSPERTRAELFRVIQRLPEPIPAAGPMVRLLFSLPDLSSLSLHQRLCPDRQLCTQRPLVPLFHRTIELFTI